MIQVKETMQDKDLKNSKSKDEGSRSRSQSMNDQIHYKQAKTKTDDKTRQPPTRMLLVVRKWLRALELGIKPSSTIAEDWVTLLGIALPDQGEGDLDEIWEVNSNCILMANLQHASTSGTQLDNAPVYDTDGSAEVQLNDNFYDNEIFNMFTQEEQYMDLLKPIPEPQLVPHNNNHVTSVAPSMLQSKGTVETSFAPNEETCAHQETVYHNLVDQVAHVNMVNCNMRATNAELKSELARYKIQEQHIEISQEKYDKLEKCYQNYQEQCLTRKINALHLSSAKQITTLNDEISNLNKQLLKEKSSISSLMEERKRLKHDFKTREDKFLDKEIDLEAKIKDLENILLKRDQTVQTMHMLNPKPDSFYHPNQKMALEEHDPPVVYDSEETLELAQKRVFVPQTTKSKEELFLLNVLNMDTVSKMISIPNEGILDDTTPSVARKFLNEVKSLLVTLQRVVKQIMTLEVHNWSSSTHKEANESLDKKKSLELKIKRLLKASVSHDIMFIVKNGFVDVPSDLQTELDRTKEKLELCIIKKEKEYVVLWNNWYTKCEEYKYDKISYDKAYNDMQQKVERLQAQLRDHKGKSSDTLSASHTLDSLNQKLESKIVELEFHVVNYEHEISHLKTTYKNLFDSIKSNRTHAKLHNLIYENAHLRARVFENTSESMSNTSGTSVTPHVDKPKLSTVTPRSKKLHASISSHSIPRVDLVPNKQSSASIRTNLITNSQRHVIVKENVSSNTVTASSTGLVHTARTRRPQPKGNTRNARVPSASKSSEVKKNVTVEDHCRTLLLSKNQKTMSSECNNIKLAIRDDKSKIACDACKQCLVTANHDACLPSSVNALNSRANNLCVNVPLSVNQKRHRTQVWKPKQVGSKERLTCEPRLPRLSLKWSPSGRNFDLKGKLVASKEINFPNYDKACTSNPQEPMRRQFPNSTVFLGRMSKFVCGLGHNLFSVGQFCDADLEVAFRRNTCFIRDLDGVDLLKGNRSTNLYTINLYDMASASPICLMARATPTKSWLWHQRLSHLNFDTINDLAKNDLVSGLSKFKYAKEHLCPSCEQGKSKRASHPPKPVPNSKQRLHLLHMNLCGPMQVASINVSMMGEMTFFLGLQVNQSPSGIFINQSKYVHEILKKYGLNTCDIVGTPIDIKDKLDLDQIETPVDATKYRSMSGALMYLTSCRPDIVHATCVCARYQAHPTEKHLKEVKRIFRYLWGTVNMGLWYTKDSGFELTGFSDVDYAGCKDTFKSTSGGAKTHELVLKETRLYIAVNHRIIICVSICLLCSSPLDANTVNRLWLSLQQDPNLL
nr:uncharacterized mitochondrial protein AtMg00810-like [Tanacetum cinerariifolium]